MNGISPAWTLSILSASRSWIPTWRPASANASASGNPTWPQPPTTTMPSSPFWTGVAVRRLEITFTRVYRGRERSARAHPVDAVAAVVVDEPAVRRPVSGRPRVAERQLLGPHHDVADVVLADQRIRAVAASQDLREVALAARHVRIPDAADRPVPSDHEPAPAQCQDRLGGNRRHGDHGVGVRVLVHPARHLQAGVVDERRLVQ